ncbi:hypothetical protein CLV95_1435 [Leptospira borgpetersenii serovar Javanica]|uniref:hypothetical protein n=1 Tax=Leptospira borgpetersenii TaxID=174 RepID=UPI000D318D6B|nr:hypothetical protein [Leptospira borgpetersenii]PTM37899.1 hypothetical protein CLV95_1435 [Leptospira borgpetersenii serovar Javanica]
MKVLIILIVLLLFLSINPLSAEGCVRSIPEATLRSDFPVKITSKYLKDQDTYQETFSFNKNQFVVIENKGCESYLIEYFFEFPSNIKINYYTEIINSLLFIQKFNESSVDLSKIAKMLKKSNERDIINKNIPISNNEFGEYFRLEKRMDKNKIIYSLLTVIGL